MFKHRRERFLKALDGAPAILPSAPVAIRSNDVEFTYRQNSDFYYLTGFPEPESLAVFAPGHPDGEFVLFVRPHDKERETWTGPRAGVEGAVADYGADRASLSEELERILPRYLESAAQVHYPLGVNERLDVTMLRLIRVAQSSRERLGQGPRALLDPRAIIHEMRLFKSEPEIDAMRRAARIAAAAHCEAMRRARHGMMEWEVEALVNYVFRTRGASGASYPPIVAGGPNATILHYVTNDRRLGAGELLLLDAGCEYDYYASDITRTFPLKARFSSCQRELYQIVLTAQLAAIDSVRPGISLEELHDTAVHALVEGMRAAGLVSGSTEEIITTAAYRRFYMHRTSHWLGMDVHDVGDYRRDGKSRQLEPGMVLTVEPGLYVSPAEEAVPAREMRATGIRIEDDILVTAQGHEVLTAGVPKTVDEIEALAAS